MYADEGEDLSLALAGDAILTRRLSVCEDDRLDPLVEAVRDADAAAVNLEVLLHDYEGVPAAQSGGTHMRAPPWVADELSWLGFDLFAAATNHAGDYSRGGMEATMRELDDRDLAYAGLGRHLAGARAPAYVDTPAGRVALVAAASSYVPGSAAGEQRPDLGGRPGVSPLGVDATYVVPEDALETLREVSDRLGLEAVKERYRRQGFQYDVSGGEEFELFDATGDNLSFEAGEEFAVRLDPDEDDLASIEARIRAADRQADWVVASLHSHHGESGGSNDDVVLPFHETVARRFVDAGADAVMGHGPHVLRGVEVYDGAPIFYSLGDFAMGNETVTRLPADMYDGYDLPRDALPADLFDERVRDDDGERTGFLSERAFWESVLPVCRFRDGDLAGVELLPLELGFEAPRPQRGRPLVAEGETAERILDDLAALSEPYGVDVTVEDGRGHLEFDGADPD